MFFQQYLIPQSRDLSGLKGEAAIIQEDALDSLIKNYCRESGVRNLQKMIEKVTELACSQLRLVLDPPVGMAVKTSVPVREV